MAEIKVDCIIVDLDGTLANADHRLHLLPGRPAEESVTDPGEAWAPFLAAADGDTLNDEIALLARSMAAAGVVVFICTARPEADRDMSERWLSKNGVAYRGMLMRQDGDRRPDVEVKREMLEVIATAGYRVRFAVEDRAAVTAMWRAEGIRCLQVCEGNY